jgi:vancomycin resistance protein YoaR
VTLPPDSTPAPPRRRGRWIALALGAGALVLVGGYVATVVSVSGSGEVPAGTTVRGVEIGGMTTQEAATTLEEELGGEAAAPIPVTAGEATTELEPEESGLAVDWEATVEQASGLILRPSELLAQLRGEVALEPITTVDSEALEASLEALAEVAAVEPTEPEITYSRTAEATYTPGVPGTLLDVPAAADVVADAYFQPDAGTLDLPMTAVAPQVAEAEAERVFAELAQPAVALPVALTVGTQGGAEIAPVDIARTLTFEPEGTTMQATLDGEKLHKRLRDELSGIERAGRDATVRIQGGKPVVVPARTGRAVDSEELGTAVFAVLPETSPDARTAVVTLTVSQPDLTTAEAKALNITEKLSSFRQAFVPAEYRYINVGEAARRLNGTILEPGETFSMNDTVKERTRANGYTEGFIISGGRFREELGGGVSIITTATWTAGFYAGLERVEQHPHGLYISRYQAGLEATVAWGLLDLRMRNETGNGVLITATRYSDGVLVEMWGTKKWEKVTATFTERRNYTDFQTIYDDGERCVPSEGVRGFSIAVTRRRINDGKSESTETFPTTYKPTPNVVCGPKP